MFYDVYIYKCILYDIDIHTHILYDLYIYIYILKTNMAGGGKPRAVGIFHSCVLNDIWMFPKIGVGPPNHEF